MALSMLNPFTEKYDCTLGHLAIAWLIAQPQTSAIVGARNAEQVKDNAKAGDIKLTPEDIAKISDIGAIVTNPLDDNPVMWSFTEV